MKGNNGFTEIQYIFVTSPESGVWMDFYFSFDWKI